MTKEMIDRAKHDIYEIAESARMVGCCEMGVRTFERMALKMETKHDFEFLMEFVGSLWDSRNGAMCMLNAEKVKAAMKEFEERNKR